MSGVEAAVARLTEEVRTESPLLTVFVRKQDVCELLAYVRRVESQLISARAKADRQAQNLPPVTGTVHELKCLPRYFGLVLEGVKPFEVRAEDDKEFIAGDMLLLKEWDDVTKSYTGRSCGRRVTFVLRDFPGVQPGYALLGFPGVSVV